MIGTIVTPNSSTLSLTIPVEMVGRKVKVIAYTIEEEPDVIEGLAAEFHDNNANIYIPQWQKDLVLAEKKRVEEDPTLLVSWETVRKEVSAKQK